MAAVSYTHLRANETVLDLLCRLLLETKKYKKKKTENIDGHANMQISNLTIPISMKRN